jgi:hypothetical protein
MNSFSLGAQVGGRLAKDASAQEQELRDMFSEWTGDYSSAVRQFAFILRIDGEFHSYTEMWSICGAQKAKRKRDWIEVEIGIPERWCVWLTPTDTRSVWQAKWRRVSSQ